MSTSNNSIYNAIPERMKNIPNWVCWKRVQKKAGGKPSKVPINPNTGGWAKSDDPATWSDFDTAVAEAHKYDGIGFQFTGSGLVGVDLDHCLDENNNLTDWGKAALEALGDSYYEKSPSGDGIHIILEVEPGKEEAKGINLRHMPDVHGGTDGAIEIYSHGRYFTVTGIGEERDIEPVSVNLLAAMLDVHGEYIDETARQKFVDTVRKNNASAMSVDVTSGMMGGAVYSGRRLNEDQMLELLRYIDPDCVFDTWLGIIFAIHSWDETKVGFEVADTWSQGGDKYLGPDDVDQHWKTGDSTKAGNVSVGTLFHYARQTVRLLVKEDIETLEKENPKALRELMLKIRLLDAGGISEVKALLLERGILSPDEFDTALEAEGGSQKWTKDELQQMIDDADSDDVEQFTKINERVADSKAEIGAISADALMKAIKKKSKISIGALREAAAAHQNASFENRSAIEKGASHGVITEHFINEHKEDDGVSPVSASGAYHRCCSNSTLWVPVEDKKLEVQIAQRYPEGVSHCSTKSDYRALAKHCNDTADEPEFFAGAPVGIAMADGFLTMDKAGRLNTEPLKAEHRQKMQFPFVYDRKFATPLWDAFLERSFAGPDMDNQIRHLQEVFGATIFRLMAGMQQAALFIGEGRTGKSTTLTVMMRVIPQEFCCAISPNLWGSEYYLAAMSGKYLNAVGEIPDDSYIPAAAFKLVTGGDLITARQPSGRPFTFYNEAAHIFNSNFFPSTRDHSNAFFRRWRIVGFNNVLPEGEVEGMYEQRLLTELSGIIAWAVEGAARLRKDGVFTDSVVHTALMQKWMNESDSVLSFLHDDEYITLNPVDDDFVSGAALYPQYRHWCALVGRKSLGMINFNAQMEAPAVIKLGVNKSRHENTRGFSGIKFGTTVPVSGLF